MSDLPAERLPVAESLRLPEISRALCQDRSHAILIVDAAETEMLTEAIVRALPGPARVEVVPLAGRDPAWVMGRLSSSSASCEGASADELEIRARLELELLAKLNASLVLVVPDALRADPDVLRLLAGLGAACGNVLRLALIAERAAPGAPDPAARLVRALGSGAAKIELGRPEAPRGAKMQTMPTLPIVEDTRARRARPIAVRPLRSSPRSRGGGSARIAQMLAVLVLAAPAFVWVTSRPSPDLQLPTVTERRASAAAAPPRIEPPAPQSAPVALPSSAPKPAPEPVPGALPIPEPRPRSELPPEPVTPARAPPARTVEVSLNARPYAEIEVDGRPVGPTPIADLPLVVGAHQIRASYPDGRVVVQTLHVDRFQNHFRLR